MSHQPSSVNFEAYLAGWPVKLQLTGNPSGSDSNSPFARSKSNSTDSSLTVVQCQSAQRHIRTSPSHHSLLRREKLLLDKDFLVLRFTAALYLLRNVEVLVQMDPTEKAKEAGVATEALQLTLASEDRIHNYLSEDTLVSIDARLDGYIDSELKPPRTLRETENLKHLETVFWKSRFKF